MIIRHFPLDITLKYPFNKKYNTDKILFFDIETTGLDSKTTYLYLIGCIYEKDAGLHMIQWFAEDISEETSLLSNFFEFLKDYDLIIHYNGSVFDIPYLINKCEMLKLNFTFDNIQSLDLYKMIFPIKKILKLNSFRQKSVETFLNIHREDKLSGQELIDIYQSYLGKKKIEKLRKLRNPDYIENNAPETEALLNLLLLHNEDDLKGLVGISPILYYTDLFESSFHIVQARVENGELIVSIEYDFNVPVSISFGNDSMYVNANGNTAVVYIKTCECELKYFYDNYRDYFYLPAEDRAIHKSLAVYVDKEYRKKATPSTCYTKKQGTFVPQYSPVISPAFKNEYNDKISFIEVHTDSLLKEDSLTRYMQHILNHIIS